MEQIQTSSVTSKILGISTRMLRYYEQAGLVESRRMDGYAYRVYDENAVRRLRQIIILRKLRVPVKQIREIFNNSDAAKVVEVFERNVTDLDEQITALSTVRTILSRLAQDLKDKANVRLQLDYLSESSVFAIVDSISFPKNTVQEEERNVDELNKASQLLNKLTNKDVRIVYLPPAAVLSHHAVGDDEQGRAPEDQHDPHLDSFEKELAKIKPDFRHYGFNHPVDSVHGYERWITIDDEMEVKPPFTKKHYTGGMYAACVLPVFPFEEGWALLFEWIKTSDKYEENTNENMPMHGLLEEHTTAAAIITGAEMYIDLLLPIKLRLKEAIY
jgi:DNA-binding transcriptional MerR regulator